ARPADGLARRRREQRDQRVGRRGAADRAQRVDGLLDDQRVLLGGERGGERRDRGVALAEAQGVQGGDPDVAVGISEEQQERFGGAGVRRGPQRAGDGL